MKPASIMKNGRHGGEREFYSPNSKKIVSYSQTPPLSSETLNRFQPLQQQKQPVFEAQPAIVKAPVENQKVTTVPQVEQKIVEQKPPQLIKPTEQPKQMAAVIAPVQPLPKQLAFEQPEPVVVLPPAETKKSVVMPHVEPKSVIVERQPIQTEPKNVSVQQKPPQLPKPTEPVIVKTPVEKEKNKTVPQVEQKIFKIKPPQIEQPKQMETIKELKSDLRKEKKFDCIVKYINSYQDFYIQKVSSGPLLDTIQPKIDACVNELDDFSTDTLCVSVFNLDNQFYRAKLQSVDEQHNLARVFYIDYGNTDTVNVNMLTKLSDELRKIDKIDKMAFNCKIEFNAKIIQEYQEKFNDFFKEKASEMTFELNFVKNENVEPYSVDLIDIETKKSIKVLFLETFSSSLALDYSQILLDDQTLASENDFTSATSILKEDDRAIADSISENQQPMNTMLYDNQTVIDEDNNAFDTWLDTPAHVRALPDAYTGNNTTNFTTTFNDNSKFELSVTLIACPKKCC
jgi:hypothetical protein